MNKVGRPKTILTPEDYKEKKKQWNAKNYLKNQDLIREKRKNRYYDKLINIFYDDPYKRQLYEERHGLFSIFPQLI